MGQKWVQMVDVSLAQPVKERWKNYGSGTLSGFSRGNRGISARVVRLQQPTHPPKDLNIISIRGQAYAQMIFQEAVRASTSAA